MKKVKFLFFLVCGAVGVVSCKTHVEVANLPHEIVLQSAQDQFLRHFVAVEPVGLSISIARNDALFAGATLTGYTELERQVERINTAYDSEDYEYWKRELQRRQTVTKTAASYVGTYDKYNVLEEDKFLENFVYAEDGKISLKISEAEAVMCGATYEGYRMISADVNELNRMVQAGEVAYKEVEECFDAKRDYIVRANRQVSLFSETLPDPPAPPQTYGTIDLKDITIQGKCWFFGPEEIIGAISSNYLCAIAYLQEQDTGKTLTLIGYNSHATFKAGLVYPEGGHFSFTMTKASVNYDVSGRFVEYH